MKIFAMSHENILKEEVKNSVAAQFFSNFDCTKILGKVGFAVKYRRDKNLLGFENLTGLNDEYVFWAEAKRSATDIVEMLAQLVLTIGKARTFDKIMPPKFLGAFDSEKIAFVPYYEIQELFYLNDFNWNVTSSNTAIKKFQLIKTKVENALTAAPWQTFLFYFEKDETDLLKFIKENFTTRHCGHDPQSLVKLRIDKNNFINVYQKWVDTVKPTINVPWENVKKSGLIDGDFYLADLLANETENQTLTDKLNVLLKSNYYVANRHIDAFGLFAENQIKFSDNQKAHNRFWAKYERPPHEDYWDYIIDRHDLLVPQDIRERKGSFYTPRIWVEKAQEYLADVLGEDWQDEYYVWDCCAGSGNLLAGLTNKYNIFASTLDKSDVDVMKQRIDNGANLLEDHVFQFDFLNDSFEEAQAVFDAGREIWKYYHSRYSIFQKNGISEYNVNASLYDIKEFFKGRDEKGKMNNRSQDEEFNRLEQNLSEKLKILAAKIEPKVYEYEFLMG
jgi:hypothetical protein